MAVLRRKVLLRQPYAGIFLKKDDNNDNEVVNNLSEIYPVGTFCHFQEFQDLGDKIRMIVTAHRRIRIVNQIYEEIGPPEEKKVKLKYPNWNLEVNISADDDAKSDSTKRRNRRSKRYESKQETENELGSKPKVLAEGEQKPVLMVEVENVKKEEFTQTDEVKALTQEVIKTLRDIISMNSLYRENLQHMIHNNQRVVNNPSYLCDLGASLASAEAGELQEVLGEEDVSKSIFTKRLKEMLT